MERRMLQTDIEGLAPAPRRRVALLPDDSTAVTLRVPAAAARVVLKAAPEEVEAHMHRVSTELYEKLVTPWTPYTSEPPCSGWWEAHIKGVPEALHLRLWFDAHRHCWREVKDGAVSATPIAWRGLRVRAAHYDYELVPRSA